MKSRNSLKKGEESAQHMTSKLLINASDSEECRIVKITDNELEDFQIENAAHAVTQGNIYKGIITRVEPALQCVFVDYGADRHGFLQKNEIHSDYFQDTPSGDQSISSVVRKGQHLLVQVTKDPVGRKGAMLTTFISLPGRHVVLMPGSGTIGVSRKITEEKERTRLKSLVDGINIPEGFGLIVRTAGDGCNKTNLARDVKELLRLWKTISEKSVEAEAPSLLYKEQQLVLRTIRDYLTADVNEILVDNEEVYREIREFMSVIAPKNIGIVKLHKGPKPIFTKYELERKIASVFENRVELKSGGSIVIDPTEALVSIDVNSGRGIQKKSVEETAYATNLEAAAEIARQLRLRDLGGLIVIDFIDMRDRKHKQAVEKALKEHMKMDKARAKLGRISQFGLLELSRQRIRPSIQFGTHLPCRFCQGKGQLPSTETLAVSFLRRLHLESLKEGFGMVRAIVPPDVADYLLNAKRRELMALETLREIKIRVEAEPGMMPKDSEILLEK